MGLEYKYGNGIVREVNSLAQVLSDATVNKLATSIVYNSTFKPIYNKLMNGFNLNPSEIRNYESDEHLSMLEKECLKSDSKIIQHFYRASEQILPARIEKIRKKLGAGRTLSKSDLSILLSEDYENLAMSDESFALNEEELALLVGFNYNNSPLQSKEQKYFEKKIRQLASKYLDAQVENKSVPINVLRKSFSDASDSQMSLANLIDEYKVCQGGELGFEDAIFMLYSQISSVNFSILSYITQQVSNVTSLPEKNYSRSEEVSKLVEAKDLHSMLLEFLDESSQKKLSPKQESFVEQVKNVYESLSNMVYEKDCFLNGKSLVDAKKIIYKK